MEMESVYKVMDFAGVRVICNYLEDIYRVEDSLLRQDDIKLLKRKDYIKNPKESGYRSLHLIIEIPIFLESEKRLMKVEIQLRTISMNFWASLEHQLRYKKNLSEEDITAMNTELIELAENAATLDARMQALRNFLDQAEYMN